MDKNIIISKIKALFDIVEEQTENTIEINLMEIVAKDGKEYQVDALEVGANVYVKEGEEYVLLIDGELEIEYEGKTWTVKSDETGKIASIEEVVIEEESPIEEEVVEDMNEETSVELTVEEEIVQLKSDMEALKTEMQKCMDMCNKMMEAKDMEMEAVKTENEELKVELSKVPAAQPVNEILKKLEQKNTIKDPNNLVEWARNL